ncbi:MAG TPA: hypothetical protein VFC44_10640 [Candidatus Saccharimonadales bacterium]|nr:hypothetical protein [Candidatus Saccharimonadales bacterium]
MWFACLRRLLKAGSDQVYVYPDIVLRPIPTVEAMERAINYVIKPFKTAESYIDGLEHGCQVTGLNHAFAQTVFEAESLLNGPPQGYAFGNMGQKSRGNYIGEPRRKKMSPIQLKRFMEKLKADEAPGWEIIRYLHHLESSEGPKID